MNQTSQKLLAVKTMITGKATFSDGCPIECLKSGGAVVIVLLSG